MAVYDEIKKNHSRDEMGNPGAGNALYPDYGAAKVKGGHARFYEILKEVESIHDKKNRDYNAGDDPLGNFKMAALAGIPPWKGIVIRLSDKMARLLSFAKRESFEVKDESVIDTLRDMAVYSILAIILYEEEEKKNASNKIR